MATLGKNYVRARRTLSQPSARVVAAIATGEARFTEARNEVRELLANGGDARALYEAETDKHRAVILLGFLRRGAAALEG